MESLDGQGKFKAETEVALRKAGAVSGRKEGLWVHYKLARSKAGLSRILLGCLGSCLGDQAIFGEDLKRLDRAISCCGGEG